jgi:hypothetical protein
VISVRNRNRAVALALAMVVISGCGDPLRGVGDLSRRIVHGDEDTSTTTTTEVTSGAVLDLKGVNRDVTWFNDGLDAGAGTVPREDLIRAVWERGGDEADFVQASRGEISAALPGIRFPRLVPVAATFVSSQLIFDRQTATLDVSTAAAFGLWAAEPYTVPRTEGQVAVLRVGLRTLDTGQQEGEILTFTLSTGRELAWVEGDYVYQLFCRTGVTEEACFAIAESTTPLSLLTSLGSEAEGT